MKPKTKKSTTSSHPPTVCLPTTTKTATKNTQKDSILRPTNGLKDSKKHVPLGSSSMLTLRHAGKHTRNRFPVTYLRQKKQQHPHQQKPLAVQLHTHPRTKKPQLRMLAPWHPTRRLPHSVRS